MIRVIQVIYPLRARCIALQLGRFYSLEPEILVESKGSPLRQQSHQYLAGLLFARLSAVVCKPQREISITFIWSKVRTLVSFTGWSVLLAGPASGIGQRSTPWLVLLAGVASKFCPRFGVIFWLFPRLSGVFPTWWLHIAHLRK